jgi:hypothetical protein
MPAMNANTFVFMAFPALTVNTVNARRNDVCM